MWFTLSLARPMSISGCGTPLLPPMKMAMAQTSAGTTLRTKPPRSGGTGGTRSAGAESATPSACVFHSSSLLELAPARLGQPGEDEQERECGENDASAQDRAPAAIERQLSDHDGGKHVADAAEEVVGPYERVAAELGGEE